MVGISSFSMRRIRALPPLAPLAAGGHIQAELLADVGAGHEGAALAGDDEGAQLRVLLHLADHLLQLGDHSGVQCIQSLGAVDGGDADAIFFLIANGLIHFNNLLKNF